MMGTTGRLVKLKRATRRLYPFKPLKATARVFVLQTHQIRPIACRPGVYRIDLRNQGQLPASGKFEKLLLSVEGLKPIEGLAGFPFWTLKRPRR
jgi:hypothetical protein